VKAPAIQNECAWGEASALPFIASTTHELPRIRTSNICLNQYLAMGSGNPADKST
jgi:hypothetical protein